MVRQGLPNTNLKPERVVFGNVGADLGLFGERFSLSVDLFRETTKDLLFDKAMGAAYGYKTMYRNDGELKTDGQPWKAWEDRMKKSIPWTMELY